MANAILAQNDIKKFLQYDPETGIFLRKPNNKKTGSILSTIDGKKYVRIGLLGGSYLAHRLAWVYFYGEQPDEIDHINGNGTDNRIINLRNVTHAQNQKNHRRPATNKSGVSGVAYRERDRVFRAYIRNNGKSIHLGHFDNIIDAVAARMEAERLYGYHYNHGADRPL
jgi:hypothetical protein